MLDGAGGIFILEKGNCVVRRVFSNGSIVTAVGTGACSTTNIGDGGPATLALFQAPMGLLSDGAGGLLISGVYDAGWAGERPQSTPAPASRLCAADSSNCKIRRYSAATGLVTAVAGLGASSCGLQGNGVPATTAWVRSPQALGSDGEEWAVGTMPALPWQLTYSCRRWGLLLHRPGQ